MCNYIGVDFDYLTLELLTTQPTQQSPAPFAGILGGPGAAVVLVRLRR